MFQNNVHISFCSSMFKVTKIIYFLRCSPCVFWPHSQSIVGNDYVVGWVSICGMKEDGWLGLDNLTPLVCIFVSK